MIVLIIILKLNTMMILENMAKSKEYRPNPIVGMGLFMDGDGIPLSFDTFPGNTNEQVTLKPLEKKIINDFDSSKFIVLYRMLD